MPGEGANHDQQALAAVWTRLTGAEGQPPGVGRMALPCRGCRRRLRCAPCQHALELVQEGTMDGTPQPIVPDLVEALGPHVLQEAADKLLGGEGHGVPTRGLRVLIATADLAIRNGEQAVVGQRDPVDIPAQVLQDLRCALHGRFAVDHPPFGPDRLGQSQIGAFLTHEIAKQSAEELREGVDRHQVGRTGRPPLGPVSGDPTSRYEAVHVWMVGQGAGPGVQDTEDPDPPAHIMGVRGKLDERMGRGAEQDVVKVLLMTTDELTELVGHGEDHVEVGNRQELLTPLFPPPLGLMAMAFGATAVAAGVVDVVCLTAMRALQQLPAQGLGPAVDKIVHGATRAGQEALAKPFPIVRPIAPEDIGHLWHERAPARAEIGHKGVDGGVHDVQGRWRQRGVTGRGTRALVAQQFLNDPQRDPPRSQVGRLGVPQGLDGGLFGETTLAHHRVERLLEGGGGQGRGPVPGGEPPGTGSPELPVLS